MFTPSWNQFGWSLGDATDMLPIQLSLYIYDICISRILHDILQVETISTTQQWSQSYSPTKTCASFVLTSLFPLLNLPNIFSKKSSNSPCETSHLLRQKHPKIGLTITVVKLWPISAPRRVSMKLLANCGREVRMAASTAWEHNASSKGSERRWMSAKVRSTFAPRGRGNHRMVRISCSG